MPWYIYPLILSWVPVVVWFYIWLRVVNRTVLREREILHGACTRLAGLFKSLESKTTEWQGQNMEDMLDALGRIGDVLQRIGVLDNCIRALNLSRRTHRRELDEHENNWKVYACDSDDRGYQNSMRFKRIEKALGLEQWADVCASACHHDICNACCQEEE